MKIIPILTFTLLSIATISCSKSSNDVEVKQADETAMTNDGEQVKVEVVNEIDPICGMSTADHLSDTAQYKGKTYGFCNPMCKEKFLETPEEYANQ